MNNLTIYRPCPSCGQKERTELKPFYLIGQQDTPYKDEQGKRIKWDMFNCENKDCDTTRVFTLFNLNKDLEKLAS